MKLTVIRSGGINGSGHIHIYARDASEIPYEGKTILHLDYCGTNNLTVRLLDKPHEEDRAIDLNDKDSVTLDSNASFVDFCQLLTKSSYRTGSQYDTTTNNCAHAALFALREGAKLKLDLGRDCKCKHLLFCCFCPSNILTPRDVMNAAYALKLQQLAESTLEKDYETEMTKINHWLKNNKTILNDLVSDIVAGIVEIKQDNPASIESLHAILKNTYELITHPTEYALKSYNDKANELITRLPPIWGKTIVGLMMLFMLLFLGAVLTSVLCPGFIAFIPLVFSLVLFGTAMAMGVYSVCHYSKPSSLSKSMKQLFFKVAEMEEKNDSNSMDSILDDTTPLLAKTA